MRAIRVWLLLLILCAGACAAVMAYRKAPSPDASPSVAQDSMMLDRRISTLEQRLYSIESRISSLEQRALTSGRAAPSPTLRDPEIDRMRSELELLRLRTRELECGVLRLDERTLPASVKEARRRAGAQTQDPCRQDANAPVQLSTRR
jgi:hypothetical protein